MSRNGSGIYSIPPGSAAVDDTIIDPVAFNTLISDLETDANTARPIVAGGTGATTAAAARTNLGATAVGASVFTAADAAAARANLGIPPDDNGNRIINGDFGIWQRATSGTGDGYVAADRWRNGAVGGTVTQARSPFNPGDGVGVSSITPTFALSQDVTGQSLASHYAVTQQRIEGVRTYAGQTVTVLGFVRRVAGSGNAVIEMEQQFGTGGSPSVGITGLSPTTITLTGTWQPFAAVITLPSIFGKVLGSNNDDFVGLSLWISAGSNFSARTNSLGIRTQQVLWHGIHIRPGIWTAADAALYVPRDPGTETALCQRYLFKTQLGVILRGYSPSAGAQTFQTIVFPVTMRGGVIATNNWVSGANNLSQTVSASSTNAQLTLTSIIGSDFAVQYAAGNSFDSEL